MAISRSLLCSHELRTRQYDGCNKLNKGNRKSSMYLLGVSLSSNALQQDALSRYLLSVSRVSKNTESSRRNLFRCRSFFVPSGSNIIPALKNVATSLTRSYGALNASPFLLKLAPAVGIIAFAVWGLGPLMRLCRIIFLHKNDITWKKSRTNLMMTSYIQPLLLWTGAILVCRVLDPIVLPTEASQAVKQRVLNFVRSLSSVMALAYCLSSLIQQAQTFFMETNDSNDTRNMGFQFAGKAVYSSVWVAAVSLFMELLGFSTQKWLTAGGLGTVLLTLAGREIFTNFLSSIMIHATRPFVLNEWIQTKIEGYEVSGTVEHVGWWSPTIIRGDDREAIHIPNHKFTMNVVRNLSQKTHWRIKNYLAISHLDVNKINNIVADMRKVLAKNPLVEQQRLHRRVFLENINPENQALMILVSCFVKTSHFEEYLCVKEAVLLDLLRVISHHRARLATPIRTVQKFYAEADSDAIFSSSRAAANRPLLLIEPSYKINGEDKAKVSPQTTRMNEDKEAKPESKANVKGDSTSTLSSNVPEIKKSDSVISNSDPSAPTLNLEKHKLEKDLTNGARKVKSDDVSNGELLSKPVINSAEMENEKSKKSNQQNTDEKIASSATSNNVLETKKSDPSAPTQNFEKQKLEKDSSDGARKVKSVDMSKGESSDTETEKSKTPPTISPPGEKPNLPPSVSRPSLEDNILLGVALEGSKRTLPIEEEMTPVPNTELKEMSRTRNVSGSTTSVGVDKKEEQIQSIPSATRNNELDKEG